MGYTHKRDLSVLRPADQMSVMIFSADQKAFTPHYIAIYVKESRVHELKVHIIRLLYHFIVNQLNVDVMIKEHERGCNNIIEVLYRFINKKRSFKERVRDICSSILINGSEKQRSSFC